MSSPSWAICSHTLRTNNAVGLLLGIIKSCNPISRAKKSAYILSKIGTLQVRRTGAAFGNNFLAVLE